MSIHRILLATITILAVLSRWAVAEQPAGLVAEWRFDEGSGNRVADSSGNGHDGIAHGANWVKLAQGYAISVDGVDDYIDCAPKRDLQLGGPVTIEAWVKPTRPGQGEAHLLGEGVSTYGLTYYNTNLCFFYIAGGGNNLKETLEVDKWQHIAATFDGKQLGLWINGRQVGNAKSKKDRFESGGGFAIGAKGRPDLPRYQGLIDEVRLYNRAIDEKEIVAHFLAEAENHELAISRETPVAKDEATQFFKTHPDPINVEQHGSSVLLANRKIGLEFIQSDRGFRFNRLYSIEQDHDFLASDELAGQRQLFEIRMTPDVRGSNRDERWKTVGSLMGIIDEMAADAFSVGSQEATTVSWQSEEKGNEVVLHLNWHQIPVRGKTHLMDVEVTIRLKEEDPLSYWRINIENPGVKYGLERVRFPLVSLAPIDGPEDDAYIYPREHGGLVEDPFNAPSGLGVGFNARGAYYPVDFNMQFQAFYDRPTGKGVYLATHDPAASLMHMQIANTPKEITWRPGHFPPNITFAEESYHLPYDCVVGPFQGDWFDAAQIYRRWATRQSWCRKGPLRVRQDVPRWYKESPFVFYTTIGDSAKGTHDMQENMVIARDHFREFLQWAGMPLAAQWYGWKEYVPGMTSYDVPFGSHRRYNQGRWRNLPAMNIHDGNYPKIGAWAAFTRESHRLRTEGGMVCPYVALEIFDQGPSENSPYADEARPNVVRGLFGKKRTWSNETAWQLCCATPWWQDRLEETCRLMTEREGIGGLYLDVMQGAGLPCYWTPHGHSAAGGDSMTRGMHELVERCFNATKQVDPMSIITGENCTENMFDVIDGTLTVTLWPENKAHIFAAVYQDYIKRYGTEMSTGTGYQDRFADEYDQDAFFIEAASLFVQGAQIGRLRLRPRDAALSLSNPAQAPMIAFLEQVLGYYKIDATKEFLSYGQFMRPLKFSQPAEMPLMAYSRGGDYPTLWNGVFRSSEGDLAIFIANASRRDMPFESTVELARHGMSADAVVDVDRIEYTGEVTPVQKDVSGAVGLEGTIPGRGIIAFRLSE
jgi:hypothetical protein